MAKTDNALDTIETELGEGSLYEESQKEKLQTLLQNQGSLKQEKDRQEMRWFELHEELESLQNEVSLQ
jgi:ATP-binding cassette subfamily F protein 3